MIVLWTRAIFISVSVAALIALVVIASVKPSASNSYGTSALYFHRTLEFPDFCLRFVSRREHRDFTEYEFDVLDRRTERKLQSFSYNVSGFQVAQFFRFFGDLYLAEMTFAEPTADWHPGDELPQAKITVWDEASAEDQRADLLCDARSMEARWKEHRGKK